MPEGHRSNDSPSGRIAVAILIAVSVGAGVFFTEVVSGIYDRRDVTPPGCTESGDCGPQGNKADILSARAAEDIVDLAVVQIWFGFIGLALIGWTLSATRAAVREAGEATEAARLAIAENRRIGEVQTRGYLSLVEASFKIDPPSGVRVVLRMRNTGISPLRSIQIRPHLMATAECVIEDKGELRMLGKTASYNLGERRPTQIVGAYERFEMHVSVFKGWDSFVCVDEIGGGSERIVAFDMRVTFTKGLTRDMDGAKDVLAVLFRLYLKIQHVDEFGHEGGGSLTVATVADGFPDGDPVVWGGDASVSTVRHEKG
jgi:hypothetical protein